MKLVFTGKKREADNIWSFYFDCEEASWKAGQSIRLELPRPTWGIEERRFTIASAPSEKRIQITTSLSDSVFKQGLSLLKPGKTIEGHNIDGNFTWVDKGEKLLIAGGVGITPYRALIKDQIDKKQPTNSTLIYSSNTKHIFEEELTHFTSLDPTLRVILLSKRLSLDKKSTLLPRWANSTIYISGSENMVKDLYQQFISKNMTKNRLKTDIFTGLN